MYNYKSCCLKANCEKCLEHEDFLSSATSKLEKIQILKKLDFHKTKDSFKKYEKSGFHKSAMHKEFTKLHSIVTDKNDLNSFFQKEMKTSKLNERYLDNKFNDQNGLLHARTISWPLFNQFSMYENKKSVSERTFIWVSNSCDYSSGDSFLHEENNRKKEIIPSITISSSSETDISPPTSLRSNSVSVFNMSSRGQEDCQINFLNPPGSTSPTGSRRYSRDSGYSGTQSTSSDDNTFSSGKK